MTEGSAPRDGFDRPLRDLRISVTDRCNFRCRYCMPREVFGPDHAFLKRAALLSFEELTRVAGIFIGLGVRKIRITGGEPMLRSGLETLVETIARLEGLEDLSLTTNGSLLTLSRARALRRAGLRRLTVSLDALDDTTFRAMNDVDFPVAAVLEGIEAASAAGFAPAKINMVVRRGFNEHQVVPMADHFRGTGHILRFVEYMDVGATNGWRPEDVVPARDIVERIGREWPLEPVDPNYPGEVAKRFRYRDGAGEVGLIASVTQPFCGGCTRARLSAEGSVYTCLFASRGCDLRSALRAGATDEALVARIDSLWRRRDDRYSELRSRVRPGAAKIEMSYIGG